MTRGVSAPTVRTALVWASDQDAAIRAAIRDLRTGERPCRVLSAVAIAQGATIDRHTLYSLSLVTVRTLSARWTLYVRPGGQLTAWNALHEPDRARTASASATPILRFRAGPASHRRRIDAAMRWAIEVYGL